MTRGVPCILWLLTALILAGSPAVSAQEVSAQIEAALAPYLAKLQDDGLTFTRVNARQSGERARLLYVATDPEQDLHMWGTRIKLLAVQMDRRGGRWHQVVVNILPAIGEQTREEMAAWVEALEPVDIIHPLPIDEIEQYIQELGHTEEPVRKAAHKGLHDRGLEAAGDVLPALIAALHDPRVDIREGILKVMGSLGSKAKMAAPAIITVLKDDAPAVRSAAAVALGRMDIANEITLAALRAVLRHDPAPSVRAAAAEGFGWMAKAPKVGEFGLPALTGSLADPSWDVRTQGAQALGRIGAHAREAKESVDELIQAYYGAGAYALQETTEYPWRRALFQSSVIEALGLIGAYGEIVLPLLIDAMQDPHLAVRLAAIEALGRFEAEAEAAILMLQKARQDARRDIREAAERSLEQIQR